MERGCSWSTTICHSIIIWITGHITVEAHLFHCLESAEMTGLFMTLCKGKIEASVKCILHPGSILGWKWLFRGPSPDLLERKKISISSTSDKECKGPFLVLRHNIYLVCTTIIEGSHYLVKCSFQSDQNPRPTAKSQDTNSGALRQDNWPSVEYCATWYSKPAGRNSLHLSSASGGRWAAAQVPFHGVQFITLSKKDWTND